ncbi:MAG: 2-oxo acid dehydrogenase subunit E2 [Anaerolineales bacterium]|nr:2-oxo acid dehydrogenase subunit E2 [Anaerolineales bacterium]
MPILDIVIPDEIGDVDECVVVTWLKREGSAVEKDEVLLILQAEKISFELPSPAAGQVTAILAQQGEVVKKGQPLARLEVSEMVATTPPAPPEVAAVPARPAGEVRASPVAKRLAREHNADLSLVAGTGEEGRITEKDVLVFVEARQAKAAPPPAAVRSAPPASPVAKRLAREHNVDLAQVSGTGEGGRVTEKDVLAFVEAQQAKAAPQPRPSKAEPAPTPSPGETIPLSGARGTIARRMHDSLQHSAQLTLISEADVTDLVRQRETLKSQFDLTYTDLVVRAVALALKEHPRLNAWVVGEEIRLQTDIAIGVAVALDDGLIVPVVRAADQKSLREISQESRRLAQRARAGSLLPAEASGSTFTVTNLGMYGVDAFTPIINPPEVAILGVGRMMERLIRRNGDMLWRQMMTLSLTFDHRAVDGAPAAAFLQAIRNRLEQPDWLSP